MATHKLQNRQKQGDRDKTMQKQERPNKSNAMEKNVTYFCLCLINISLAMLIFSDFHFRMGFLKIKNKIGTPLQQIWKLKYFSDSFKSIILKHESLSGG